MRKFHLPRNKVDQNESSVSEPGHDHRSFQVMTKLANAHYVDPESYLATAPRQEGSWWPEWVAWLNARSGASVDPPAMGAAATGFAPKCDAPGTYVLQQ